MSDTQEITEFDLSLLPGWDDELKCESKHSDRRCPKSRCTVEVVARGTTCTVDILICQASYEFRQYSIASNGRCSHCKRQTADCWKVTPV